MTTAPRETAPFIYLPIEVSARELDAKLLIAYVAVGLGFEAVIGQKWLMQRNMQRMPPGIMLFKTLTKRDARAMKQARARGYRIAAIDEEVPGLITRQEGSLRWVDREAVELADVMFACGPEHAEGMAAKYPASRAKTDVAGNPRWDLLRPEFRGSHAEEVAAIRQEFGGFVLVNTNLGFTNSGKGTTEQMVRTLERGGKFDRRVPADAAFLAEHIKTEQASLAGITDLLRRLPSALPNHRIILRPHPSENAETWSRIIAGLPRVEMVRRGSAVPWILAADLLLHTYCTTGVEAFALGKPAICFTPRPSPIIDNYLSPLINFPAKTVDEVVARATAILAGPLESFAYPPEFQAIFERSFVAQSGPFAAERIARALAERFHIALRPEAPRALWRPGRGFTRRIRTSAHNLRLMPGVEPPQLAERLQRFGRELDQSRELKVSACGDRLFHIHGHAEDALVNEPSRTIFSLPRWFRRLGASARPA
jgi:surface carbohydrate biosynthesis protein